MKGSVLVLFSFSYCIFSYIFVLLYMLFVKCGNHLIEKKKNPLSYDFEKIRLICKASSIASHKTRWHNKIILIKEYSIPLDFPLIEIYNLMIVVSSFFCQKVIFLTHLSTLVFFILCLKLIFRKCITYVLASSFIGT